MEILSSIDKFEHPTKIFGYKSLSGSDIIIDYGYKRYIRLESLYSNIYSTELYNTAETICNNRKIFTENKLVGTSRNTYEEIVGLHKFAESVIFFREFGEYFYLNGSDALWYSEDPAKELMAVRALMRHFKVKGVLLYTKQWAGYIMEFYGKEYFLPKGETLSTFRYGMLNTNYINLLYSTGFCLEALIAFMGNTKLYWGSGENFKESIEKLNSISCLLEYSVVEQLLLFKGKRLGYKGKHGKNVVRGYLYEILYFHYKYVAPFLKTLNRLLLKVEYPVVMQLLAKGLSLRGFQIKKEMQDFMTFDNKIVSLEDTSLDTKDFYTDLYLLEVYAVYLESLLDKVLSFEFSIDENRLLKVGFSRVVSENKYGYLTSVSRVLMEGEVSGHGAFSGDLRESPRREFAGVQKQNRVKSNKKN